MSKKSNILALIEDIRLKYVDDEFNARFSAKKKTYSYNFYINRINNPYLDDFCYKVSYKLDMKKFEDELNSFIKNSLSLMR